MAVTVIQMSVETMNNAGDTQSRRHMLPELVYSEDSSEEEQRNHKTKETDGKLRQCRPHRNEAASRQPLQRCINCVHHNPVKYHNSTQCSNAKLHIYRQSKIKKHRSTRTKRKLQLAPYNTLNQNFTAKQHNVTKVNTLNL